MQPLAQLSKKFYVDCKNDLCKWILLIPKIILQGLSVWPDSSSNKLRRTTMIFVILNLVVMEIGQIEQVLKYRNNIATIVSTSTTISTTAQTIIKLSTMIYYREPLNFMLRTIWKDFWAAKYATETHLKQIKFISLYVATMGLLYQLMAFFSATQFMAFPMIVNSGQLPLPSSFPFNENLPFVYELIYLWQWLLTEVIILTLASFDMLANSIIVICACQFIILQGVLQDIVGNFKEKSWWHLFAEPGVHIDEMFLLKKCIKQHLIIIHVCNVAERTFRHIVFMQFVISTFALCVSCVSLVAVPSLRDNMLSFAAAHLVQFFIYCSTGNELSYQSGRVAEAIYASQWENSTNLNFRRSLILVIQRAQKQQSITVMGLMELSYANFFQALQLSFSFYTLLNTFL